MSLKIKGWRIQKPCATPGCARMRMHLVVGNDYALDYCDICLHRRYDLVHLPTCTICGTANTFSRTLCMSCSYNSWSLIPEEPCIFSCCYKGQAWDTKIIRTWFVWWYMVRHHSPYAKGVPTDIYRYVARKYLSVPHRECHQCGPGIWYPVAIMKLTYRDRVWLCARHFHNYSDKETIALSDNVRRKEYFCNHFQDVMIAEFDFFPVRSRGFTLTIGKSLLQRDEEVKQRGETCIVCKKKVHPLQVIEGDKGRIFCSKKCQNKKR
jgi:hypothetical protein